MSTPYGLNAPLYVHSGQSDLHSAQFVEPYSMSRMMRQSGQHFVWDNLANTPGAYGSTVFLDAQPVSPMLANTQVLDPEEDKDEFATFGTCVSVRGEQLAYDPMQAEVTYLPPHTPATLDLLTTDVDDTLSNAPIDGPLEDEEQIAINMQNSQAHSSDYAHMLQEDELQRRQNTQYGQTDGEQEQAEEVEEIIEEEIHTVKHGRPAPVAPSPTRRQTTEHIHAQNKSIHRSRSRHRDKHVDKHLSAQRRHVIDLDAPVISESQFPASYWSRLEQLFRSRFEMSRPVTRELAVQVNEVAHRTTATMATPSSSARERVCFGVSVCPSTQSVGVSCPRAATREFGCTPIETEAVVQDWVENKLLGASEATRKFVHKMFKSSMRSHEEFLEEILRLIKPDTHHVGVQVKPEQRSQFACTKGGPVVSTASGDSTPVNRSYTESKMIEARPTLINRSTLTRHSIGPSVACETESPLLRSQGAQAVPDIPDVTCCGIQVGHTNDMTDKALDPIDFRTRRVATGTQTTLEASETVVIAETSEEIERFWQSRSRGHPAGVEKTDGGITLTTLRKSSSQSSVNQPDVAVVVESAVPRDADHETRSERQDSTVDLSRKDESRTEPQSTEVRSENKTPESASAPAHQRIRSGGEQVSESLRQSVPYWTNTEGPVESFTVSTERRMVDEVSQRHLLPSDVDLDELTRGGPEALDAALRRSRDLGTTHVVREFPPEVEVVRHVDEPISPTHPYIPTLSESILTEHFYDERKLSSNAETEETAVVYQIPVMHDSGTPRGTSGSPRVIPVERASEPYRTSLSFRVDSAHSGRDPRSTSVRESDTQFQTSSQAVNNAFTETKRFESRGFSGVAQIPRRNHSFDMPAEALNACEVLTEQYRNNRATSSAWSDSAKEELEKLRTIWFDLTSTTQVELNKLEDFVAILHGYHEHLLRDVMQSVDDNGSTSLHYAVGHCAWPVVNLILDSGYAEPDRLNRAGFSPIMISTVCNVSDSTAMRTLDRLFRAGNVNLRAHTNTQQTPLMLAAVNGSLGVLTLLLQHGAQVNLQDTSGNTALMFALEHGDMQVINALLARPELNLSLKDNDGKNALEIAESKRNTAACERIKRIMAGNAREYAESVSTTSTTMTTTTSNFRRRERRSVHDMLRGFHRSRDRPHQSGGRNRGGAALPKPRVAFV